MNIGFFTNTYLPNVYGLTSSIESFRKGLEALGHTVYVFAPKTYGYTDANKNVIRYPSLYWKYKIEYSIALSWYPPMNKVIDVLKLDVIHVHQPFSVAKDGWRQARRLGIPVVFTNHTRYEDYTHYVPLIPQSYLKRHVRRAATKFANSCDWVITPSRDIEEIIKMNGVMRPITILPTGIDWERYQRGQRDKIRQEYGIGPDESCLLWTGRMEKEKNTDFLMDVSISLVSGNEKVKMLLVGEGSEKKKMQACVVQAGLQEKIFFQGLVKPEEMPDYYSAGDIFLQPSMSETQGLTTTEALATGLAVVAIRASGTTDQIESGANGIMVDNDQPQFITAVKDMIADGDKRRAFGEKAREMAKKMDFREKAGELVGIYEDLMTRNV